MVNMEIMVERIKSRYVIDNDDSYGRACWAIVYIKLKELMSKFPMIFDNVAEYRLVLYHENSVETHVPILLTKVDGIKIYIYL